MKIAICFLISRENKINKEHIWIRWLEENKDIVNIYIHYSDYSKIKSQWIKHHIIPKRYIIPTDYYHIVPAYMSLMEYASFHDKNNKWFCFVTESCCPIIPASKFRSLFLRYHQKSIITHKPIWWNPSYVHRASLLSFKKEYHLANNPWFILSRYATSKCLSYRRENYNTYNLICRGNIANESIFAIILHSYNMLNREYIINEEVVATDWTHMDSPTSPHSFHKGSEEEIQFIDKNISKKYTIFLRKVTSDFPNEIIYKYTNLSSTNNNNKKYSYYFNSILYISMTFFFIYKISISIFYHTQYK
jgi:hypothetical protein